MFLWRREATGSATGIPSVETMLNRKLQVTASTSPVLFEWMLWANAWKHYPISYSLFLYLEGSPKGTHFSSQDSEFELHLPVITALPWWLLLGVCQPPLVKLPSCCSFFFYLKASLEGILYLDVQLTSSKGRPGSLYIGCSEHSTGMLSVCLSVTIHPSAGLLLSFKTYPFETKIMSVIDHPPRFTINMYFRRVQVQE